MTADLLIVAAAGLVLGTALGLGLAALYVWRTVQRIQQDLQTMMLDAVKQTNDHMMGLVVEQDGNMIYAYTELDHQFVCQGVTIEQIQQGFAIRYPEKTAYLAGGDAALLERFRTELSKSATDVSGAT